MTNGEEGYEMTLDIPPLRGEDFPKCAACKVEFGADEPRTIVVKYGSAWENGMAFLDEGAEIYRMAAYHDAHVPEDSNNSPDSGSDSRANRTDGGADRA